MGDWKRPAGLSEPLGLPVGATNTTPETHRADVEGSVAEGQNGKATPNSLTVILSIYSLCSFSMFL